MKFFFILLVLFMRFSFDVPRYPAFRSGSSINTDSNIIIHKHDGILDEWPVEKFSVDVESAIHYAIDNDAQHLYLALKIADQQEQIQMMQMGMNIFFDLKGKRKEKLGIEFPLKSELERRIQMNENSIPPPSEQRAKIDLQSAKFMFGTNMLGLKLFGFTQAEPFRQNLDLEGSAKIAFTWDSTNLLQIEYLIPLKIFNEQSSLHQKVISIGFKVNGIVTTTSSGVVTRTTTELRGESTGSGAPVGSRVVQTSRNVNQVSIDKVTREQKFWTKYTFMIPL